MRAGPLRIGLLLGLLLAPCLARAQTAADEAFDAGRLDEATGRYGRELESGRLEPERLAHVHRRLAELAALASLDDEAAGHLSAALAIDPDAELSEALAERAERPSARARVIIGVSSDTDPIEIAVRDAPEGLVRTLAVRGSDGHERALPWEGRARVLEVPAAARPIEVRALDRHGNTVASAGRAELPPPEPEPDPEPEPLEQPEEPDEPEEDADDGLVESPWLWIAVGLVVVGVGVAIGVSASGERFVVGAPEVR